MSHHESSARGPDARMVDRMLFFSDAVFAIVLTIMVLELHPLELAEGLKGAAIDNAIWGHILGMWRVWFAYLLSFGLVGMWWTVHMRVTRAQHQFDWPTAVLNLLFLLTVSVIPFAASILGQSVTSAAAWQVYWGVNALAAFSLTLMLFVVSRGGGRLIGGMGGRERAARLLQAIGPGLGFVAGVWLATIGEVALSRYCWVVIPPCMIVARLIYPGPKLAAVE